MWTGAEDALPLHAACRVHRGYQQLYLMVFRNHHVTCGELCVSGPLRSVSAYAQDGSVFADVLFDPVTKALRCNCAPAAAGSWHILVHPSAPVVYWYRLACLAIERDCWPLAP